MSSSATTKRATPAKPVQESLSDALSSSSSWSLQQQEQQPAPDTLEKTAEHACELFSSTLSSLSHDVRALGHLTTWKDLLDDDNNNDDPNNKDPEAFMESLCDLDDVVSSVEQKVGVLRQIVVEEQRALEQLNLLHKDSLEQNENLEYLVERCLQIKHNNNSSNRSLEEREAPEDGGQSSINNNSKGTGRNGSSTSDNNKRNTKSSSFPGPGMSVSSHNSSSRYSMDNTSHNSHAHAQGLTVYLDRVTQEELESVPRTTRGRTQVTVINDALDHIEKAFHKKALKERKQVLLLQEAKYVALAHYQNRSPEKVLDDEELLHNLVVTEQELRQSCSFFTLGELNARTILTVLKALRRIKQVPATKGKVLYKLCL